MQVRLRFGNYTVGHALCRALSWVNARCRGWRWGVGIGWDLMHAKGLPLDPHYKERRTRDNYWLLWISWRQPCPHDPDPWRHPYEY